MTTDTPHIPQWCDKPSPSPAPNTNTNPNKPKRPNKRPIIPISIDKLRVSDLDTSVCQNVDFFFQAHALAPENAVNEQTDRWTDRETNNNIHKHPWMLSVSHLDTSACQIVGHFFQALCLQYTNPSPRMVGRTDERMKWQQYPSASMLAKGKSSGNICISNSMPFLPSDLSANVQKPENEVNGPIDGQTDGRTNEWQGGTIAGGYCYGPMNLV